MSNYIEFNDKIAFHPGYYIKEIVDESGLTQEDFAKRLGTTPKNLSILVRGEQSLSIDIAMKMSRMIGTSIEYWLNLQKAYDVLQAEYRSQMEMEEERAVFSNLNYKYFRDNYRLPDLSGKRDEQIKTLRSFLNVATLSVLKKRDMSVNFRSSTGKIDENSIIKANTMVQIATNDALKVKAPRYNKKKLESTVDYLLTLTDDKTSLFPKMKDSFLDAGIILEIQPDIPGSRTNGATKKIGNNIMLMVNDRRLNADIFWFTLLHEVGHIMKGDFGISFEDESGEEEAAADKYADERLIPKDQYTMFIECEKYDLVSIRNFANIIDRDPGIVLGRLQRDNKVRSDDAAMKSLRYKYKMLV
ncbi:MAG TPA: addiction module antidote protein, HigA family [Lachnospiraceae bacterium]|nr:addiction module antidote protein, HigA family [Lachnospiraceae bacterium]